MPYKPGRGNVEKFELVIVPNTSILKLLLISPLVVQCLLEKANVKKEIKKVKQIKKRQSKSNLKAIRS